MNHNLLYGFGVNDSEDPVCTRTASGREWCPFYRRWIDMLRRCYSEEYHYRHPTYKDCRVSEEWRSFSRFKEWMARQDWRGKHLDKDLLVDGNRIYYPEYCTFVDPAVNAFVTDRGQSVGDLPTGVFIRRDRGKFRAQCGNPFTGKREVLGTFTDPDEAHQAWKRRKHELACQWADVVPDARLAAALRSRYK